MEEHPLAQKLTRTDKQLSFLESRDRKDSTLIVLGCIVAGGFAISSIASVVSGLAKLVTDATLITLGNFLGTLFVSGLYLGIAGLIVMFVSSASDRTIVFDKATNEFRVERQQKIFRFNRGAPVPLQMEMLSDISHVVVGTERVQAEVMGVTRAYQFEPVAIFVRDESQPIYAISLTRSFGQDPYEGLISPTQLATEIREFLGLTEVDV